MSPGVHTEKTFEDVVEAGLLASGWTKGTPATFDREVALDPSHLFHFIQDTQPALWSAFEAQHGDQLEPLFLEWLAKERASRGTLDLLRHGMKFYGKQVELAYFRPAHSLNPEAADRYAKNRLVVVRQLKFRPDGEDSIDLVLFLNGLPVVTSNSRTS